MVTFKTSLSPSALNKLAQELTQYGKSFEAAKLDVLQALMDYTYERIMYYVPVDTGELMDSFVIEVSSEIGRVYTDKYYAKYVEFGTGIKGEGSGYDLSSFTVSDTWKGYSQNFSGQVAQKFMYRALQDLENNYESIARSVLAKKGLL